VLLLDVSNDYDDDDVNCDVVKAAAAEIDRKMKRVDAAALWLHLKWLRIAN